MEAVYKNEIIDDEKVNEVMKKLQELFNDVTFDVSSTEVTYNSEERIEKRFEDYKKQFDGRSMVKIIPTGIDLLDASFDNLSGFESGRVYLFGGAYGSGKTRLMTFFAMNAYRLGYNVLHITIENSIFDVEKLYDSIVLKMPIDELYRILRKSLTSDQAVKELQGIKTIIKNTLANNDHYLEIKKFRPHRVNMALIESYVKRKIVSGEKKPDMIILDHVDLMIPNVKDYHDEYSKGESIINDVKDFVERYNIILLSPTQFNREGIKVNSTTSSDNLPPVRGEGVAGSLAKLKASDFYITMNQNDNESLDNICRLYIDKNRFGISRVIIPIIFDKGTMDVKPLYPTDSKFNFNSSVINGINKLMRRMNNEQYINNNNVEILNNDSIDDMSNYDTILFQENGDNFDI
jgi:KaiC/GvpD/RAD55 family RecA-like ATPase